MADIYRKLMDKVGLGGVHCYCCNSYFGKDKKRLNRLVRHKMKNELRKHTSNNDYYKIY